MAVYKYGQAARATLPTATATAEQTAAPKQDNGGFLGGIGYVAEKAGLGFLSTFEGVWDYAAGGIASMFGNNEWAEQQFKNDWVDYSHPDTWYQPSDGWKVAGDVASGIGNSAANLVPYGIAAAVTYFSGGTLAPVAAAIVKGGAIGSSIALAGVGAAGQSTKQAYQETGKLGQAEYGYGAMSGATEGLLEGATNLIGFGSGAVAKSLSRAAAKEAAETVAKETIGKTLIKGFAGEAFEEGMSAFLEPQYAKITYDPNAQNATAQEIAYSAFVGGLAGMVMGGTASVAEKVSTRVQDRKTGEELVAQGKEASILEMAREVAETERNTPTGDHAFEYTKEAYDKLMQSLATTDGKVTNDSQKRMLGEVARWSSFSAFSPMISKSAANIYQNAEAFAERLNAYYSSVGGNMSVTAEEIRNGLDPKDPKTFKTALETNPTLRMLAIADATGHLFLDSTRFAQAAAEGRGIATQDDINRLLETADEAKINALSQRYGVDLRTATASEFNKAVTQYMQNGGYDTEMGEVRRSKAAKGADEKTAKTKLPKAIALKDGETVRYKIGDEDFSITREGDGYYLHDNKTDRATRKLTKAEVNKRLADYRQQSELSKPDTGDNAQKKTAETVDAWAGENVIGYNKLGNADKVGIRRLINTARAMGVSDADIAIYASISARSGVKITFESKPKADYNGYYSHKDNLITINIANTKSAERTLIHELDHAIRAVDGDFYIPVKEAADALTDEEFMQVMEAYSDQTASGMADELTAHGAEKLLAGQGVLTRLMDEQPKLLDRVLAFFKGAESDYKALPRLSKEAKRYYKKYKKMFDALSFRNASGLNTEAASMSEDGTIRLQMKQYEETGRDTLLKYLRKKYGKATADDLISTIDNIYSVMAEIKKDTALSVFGNWQDTDVELDEQGRPIFTTSIKNGDYSLNQDFSRVCKKRRQLNFVLNMLAEDPAFEASNLTQEDFVKINKAIKEHGFEIACALCFVDAKRYRQSEWADSFASTWNDILYSVVENRSKLTPFNFATKHPNMSDDGIVIDTSKAVTYRKWSGGEEDVKNRRSYESLDRMLEKDGNAFVEGNANVRAIAKLIRDNPNLRHEFRGADILASDGFDSIQRLAPDLRAILDGWGGSSVPKPSSNDAIYDNSILNIQGYNPSKAFAVGGVRMNSFSDFMAHMFFDYVQAFADLSAKKLPMHSYTKELDFARLFGLTGGKVNMSAIAAIRSGKSNDVDFERSIAGLDISRLAEKLGKDESAITYDDVIENLDDVDYVWADESIDVKSATLLQSGILYDKLTDAQATYCYELIREGKFDEAFRVAGEENVNRGYAKHLGIITVGVSKAHIIKLLRDPTIRMVIPYHRSGINPVVAEEMNIAFYDDFTDTQNTSVKQNGEATGIASDSSKIDDKKLQDFSFYDYFGKTIDGVFYDGKATAKKYLDWCRNGVYDESVGDYVYYFTGKGGYILASELHARGIEIVPKFSEFSAEENYYKLIEDFDCYDTITGEHSSQDAVDLFHDGLPADYKDVLVRALKAEQKVSDDFQEHLDHKGLRDEIMAIVSKRGYTPSVGRTPSLDLAASFRSTVGDRLLDSPAPTDRYMKQLKKVDPVEPSSDPDIRKSKVLPSDTEYLAAVERGDMETAQRMVDEAARLAGYDVTTYHGTDKEFTVFKTLYRNEFGYHTGTRKAAEDRVQYQLNAKVLKLYTNLGNTIRTPDVFGYFAGMHDYIFYVRGETDKVSDMNFLKQFGRTKKLKNKFPSNDTLNRLHNAYVEFVESGYKGSKANAVVELTQEYLRSIGVDSIAYTNAYESAGSTSYLLMDSNRVKSADPVTYDDEGNIIPLSERFNPEKSDIRYSRPVESATIGAVMTSVDEGYKAGKMETLRDTAIATQIAITNAQAGIEAYGKKHGIKDIEARVQAVRSAQGQAGEMIGGHQYRIGGATNEEKRVYLGQGLQEIMRPINDYGKGQKVSKNELKEIREAYKREFFDYLFNHLNVDRMTLESRSMDEQKARLEAQKAADADVKSLTRRYKQILEKIGKLGRTKTDLAEKKTLRAEAKDLAAQIRKLQKEMKERQNEIEAFEPRQNKPVLRKDDGRGGFTEVSADESREQIKKYDEERPEFKEIAEKMWAFLRNLNQYRVDTGLLSQDTADLLADLYAHYVPSYRADSKVGIAAIDGKRILGVRQTVKGAKGSLKDLLPIDVMIARQVEETVRAGRINQLANILYETAIDGETDEIQILSKDKVTTEEMAEFDPTSMRPKDGQITFYRDGEKIVMRVSKEIFAGFDAFTPQIDSKNPLANTLTAINNAFKKLVTSMNPAFLARNTIRDIQDAGINTKYPKTFVQNYARAAQEIMKDGELWRLYRAFGGYSSSIFDFDSGMQGHQNRFGFTQVEGNLLQRGITAIENANAFTEQLPRFAEFISAIEAGKSVEQAILDAADVTTNFGRSGRVVQVLNRTLVPFLNPAIQGFSKMIRNVTSIRTAREFGSLALKVTLIGLLPQAINMLMYGGDDDYEELKDTDKENNFLFKVGDKFVKLPRGRVAAALGGLVNRTASAVKGEDADWWGYVENVFQQVTPVDSMSRDIFSPIRDVQFNTTWYGSPIEGRQFDNTAPKDRYDESTSSIAKAISDGLHAIGLGFGISPKKVHYLLDQYSGVIGDFVLPATTAKPERDFLSGNFTIDPVASNELSTKFYKLYDEAVYARTDGDDTATYQVRYLTKVKNAISDMYDRKREIERSNLSDKEKQAETRVIQILINEAYRTALADYSLYTDAVKATSGIEDANIRFAEATRLVYGAERALKDYDGEVYKRASALKAAGVDYDTYYSYYFSTKDIEADKDIRGNDISGSKRKKVVSTITAMKIPKEQKMILINAAGYAVKDGDIRGVKASTAKGILWRYIRNAKGLTEEQMEILARVCGFSVKNGKIVMNG